MIGLDCNILVQLAFADHPVHSRTIAAVHAEVQQGRTLVFPPLIITEFLHISTDPRRFSPTLTMAEAIEWVEEFISSPFVSILESTAESLDQSLRWMREFDLGRKRVLDTHFAAVLHVHGVKRLLSSNPNDFAVFRSFEIVAP